MSYVDGFVIAVPKHFAEAYAGVAQRAGAVWMEYGALSYFECAADDLAYGEKTSFPRAVQAKDDETIFLSWIVYPSREARDEINKKVMNDPRLKREMENMPVDMSRMVYGGFRPVAEY